METQNYLFNPFAGPSVEKVVHTTKSQAEIWIACEFGGEDANRAYNESISLIFSGNLNKEALEYGLKVLVQRHESLRSVFSTDGRFVTIFKELSIEPFYQDISKHTPSEKNILLNEYLHKDANYIFDLVKGPLLKVGLLKLNEFENQLIITAHHIICDGWSFGIILEELGSLYSAFILNETPSLPQAVSFSSFADEQLVFMETEEYKKTEQFWLEQYSSNVPQVNIPTDFPRPKLRTFESKRFDFNLDNELITSLKKVGVQAGCSFVTTLLAAFEVFLYGQTGQDDLVVGLPTAGQSLSGKTQLIGHCVNLLPLRTKLTASMTFEAYLKNRKSTLFDAYDHQQLSFGQLLQKLSIPRDPSRIPLVPIVFNIDMGMTNKVSFAGLTFKKKSNPRAFEAFELFLNASGTINKFILEWSYNSSLFMPTTIEQMMATFKETLEVIVANPSVEIGNIFEVEATAYSNLNNTQATYPQLPLHELIAKQCQSNSSKLAIKSAGSAITYENLEKQAHQLAHYLVGQGVNPGDYVAVSLPRSIELITVLMAIMECGAAYLPLDPNYPSKRLEFMLEDSESKFLLTTETYSLTIKSGARILLIDTIFSQLATLPDTPLNLKIENNQIAYLLYTSGSTGKPKGVPVTHKNLVNLLYSVLEKPGIQETDKVLSITTISFDIAGFELYASLLKGAQLVLTDEETAKDPRLLLDVIKDQEITVMEATPATWQMLLDTGWEKHLPIKAFCTGEALPIVLAKKILENVDELWNLYGPTETTIWSAIKQILKSDEVITIGHPIANTQMYIVNEQGRLVEPGKTGELCIAGDGVANGYWKRPDLTAEKFIKNPFESILGPVLYRTGDLVKLLPSGEIQCLGRIDQQIKIRGHRIELGEIEQELDSLVGVLSSIVSIDKDRLIANLILLDIDSHDANQVNVWKEILRLQLPSYMVPQQFNLVKEFPTTLNGKIDRKALLKLLPNKTVKTSYTEPSTPSEKIIAAIWQECLGIEKIDVLSDFFELGGHSVIAVRVMTKLEEQTGNRLPLVALLKNPTIKTLAAYMDGEFITWDSLVLLKSGGTKPPLYIVHGAHHNVLIFNDLAQKLDKDQPVYGLQARGLDGIAEPHDSMHDMARDYIKEIQITNPNGPYCLAGFSLGGTIAFEMARQLREQGKEVKIVAEFDTYVFPKYYFKSPIKKKMVSVSYTLVKIVFVLLNMITSKKNFKFRTGLFKLHIKGLFLRLKYGKEKSHEMQFHRSLEMEINHNKASDEYNIIPQDIVIDLFKAEEEINFVHDKKFLGWTKLAKKGVRRHMVPGNHIDMFDKSNVEVFATKLQYVLDNHNLESVQ